MVTISKALKAAQVLDYHKKDYTNAKDNYYSKGDQISGQWHGKLAEHWGLRGSVAMEQFGRLAQGQDPHTGEQRIRHRIATANSAEHRAGWDATFAPPKSVSITGLVGGDKAILAAHRMAVQEAINFLESHVNAHLGGSKGSETTGRWVAALFEHDSSRPVDGFAAPQLHTHVVFFNMTQTDDGKFHALQEHPIFQQQNLATTIYQSRLAHELYRLGYDLEQGKNHSQEIKGYTPAYLQANSDRSATIAEGMKQLEKRGIYGAEARQILAHSTRESKSTAYSPEVMRQIHQDLAAQYGNQHVPIIQAALAQRHSRQQTLTPDTTRAAAQQALRYAVDRGFETEAVVSKRLLLRDAMRRGMGTTTFEHVAAACDAKIQTGSLILAGRKNGPAYTTPAMIALEKENIQLVLASQVKHAPIVPRAQIRQDKLAYLRPHQHAAGMDILTSRDRIQGLQGAAGTGKTTTLRVIREELEHHGYRVRGYAPTSRAAHNLSDAGIQTTTLQHHLVHGPDSTPTPTVHFIDESSLASTKQINDFLTTLPAQDRAVLVGDVRQHESVEAGRVFAQLQENGMQTSHITQIQRQADPVLREIVQMLSEGRAKEAFRAMNEQGHITEIADPQQRYAAITQDYLDDPEHTLVLTTDNRSRQALNRNIHEALRDAGHLTGKDRSIPTLVTRQDIREADKRWAGAYAIDDTVRFTTGSKKFGIASREYVKVTATSPQDNTVTILKKDGASITYDPNRNHGVTVYHDSNAQFAVGERIQFTQPFKEHKIANRDLGTVTSIGTDKAPSLTVKLDSGRQVTFDPANFRHIDYGYTVTSYSAQSLTTTNTISNLDTAVNAHLINERMAYVTESRGTHTAKVYTNDTKQLEKYFSQNVSKTSALDGINSLSQTPSTTPPERGNTPQRSAPTPTIPSPGHPSTTPTPAPLISEPDSELRPQAYPLTPALMRVYQNLSSEQQRAVEHMPHDQRAAYLLAHDTSQPQQAPPQTQTIAETPVSIEEDAFRLRLPAQYAAAFTRMSHDERAIYIRHYDAYQRMAPPEAATFAKLSLAERSAYLEQNPALTQPIQDNPHRSTNRQVDHSQGIGY